MYYANLSSSPIRVLVIILRVITWNGRICCYLPTPTYVYCMYCVLEIEHGEISGDVVMELTPLTLSHHGHLLQHSIVGGFTSVKLCTATMRVGHFPLQLIGASAAPKVLHSTVGI